MTSKQRPSATIIPLQLLIRESVDYLSRSSVLETWISNKIFSNLAKSILRNRSGCEMVSLLKSYEQQYGIIMAGITEKLAAFKGKSFNPEDPKVLYSQIERDLEEGKDILEQMCLEIRELDGSVRSKYLTRIESFQAELHRLEIEGKRFATSRGEDYFAEDSEADKFIDLKQKLLNNSEKLERGTKRLNLGFQIAIETEQIGNNILTELSQQKEIIHKAKNRLRETDDDIGRSGRILSRMSTRILKNRLLVIGSAVLIILIVIIGLFIKLRKS